MQARRWIRGVALGAALSFGVATNAFAAVVANDFTGSADCGGDATCDIGEAVGFVRQVNEIGTGDGTSYNDLYDFTLSSASNIIGSFFTNNTLSGFNTTGVSIELFYDPAGLNTSVGSFNVPDGNGSIQSVAIAFLNLLAGDYRFVVDGFIPDDQSKGQYQLQANISAVPLPPAIWLFISALIGLVSFARIRRNGTAA